eukprot:12894021-Prorocentrum_lima.AAC.1
MPTGAGRGLNVAPGDRRASPELEEEVETTPGSEGLQRREASAAKNLEVRQVWISQRGPGWTQTPKAVSYTHPEPTRLDVI